MAFIEYMHSQNVPTFSTRVFKDMKWCFQMLLYIKNIILGLSKKAFNVGMIADNEAFFLTAFGPTLA